MSELFLLVILQSSNWQNFKALAKQTRKLKKVNASLQNQNLRTELRRVAKWIRKLAHKLQKAVHFMHIIG